MKHASLTSIASTLALGLACGLAFASSPRAPIQDGVASEDTPPTVAPVQPSQRDDSVAAIVPGNWIAVLAPPLLEREHLVDELDACLRLALAGAVPSAGDALTTRRSGVVWRTLEETADSAILCALTVLDSPHDDIRMARLTGGALLLLNGEPFVGDPNRWGHEGVPLMLKRGPNHLAVFHAEAGFELELWKPNRRLVIAEWDSVSDDALLNGDLQIPIYNASPKPIEYLHFHYGNFAFDHDVVSVCPLVDEWRDGSTIVPFGLEVQEAWGDAGGPTVERPGWSPIEVYEDHEGEESANARWVAGPYHGGKGRALPEHGAAASANDHVGRTLDAYTERRPEHWTIVYATGGSEQQQREQLALARFDAQSTWYHSRHIVALSRDTQWLGLEVDADADAEEAANEAGGSSSEPEPWAFEWAEFESIVLYGDPLTNRAWSAVLADAADDPRTTAHTRTPLGSGAGTSPLVDVSVEFDPFRHGVAGERPTTIVKSAVVASWQSGADGYHLALLARLTGLGVPPPGGEAELIRTRRGHVFATSRAPTDAR